MQVWREQKLKVKNSVDRQWQKIRKNENWGILGNVLTAKFRE